MIRRFLLVAAAGAIALVGLSANQCAEQKPAEQTQPAPEAPPMEQAPAPDAPADGSPPAEQ
ncbi:MAG: hypothetical protein ACOYB4_02980 [Methyloceanibacter sp.]